MASVSFSLTEKLIIAPILRMQAPPPPEKGAKVAHWTATIWQIAQSEIAARIIAIFTSVFAATDAFIHLLAGISKGACLLIRNVCCLRSLSFSNSEIGAHFRQVNRFARLAVIGSVFGVVWPKILTDRHAPIAQLNGNVLNITNPQDTICYLNNRSDQFVTELQKRYSGLKDVAHIDGLLRVQNYIEVLNHLWSEGDQNVRIKWLEKKFKESHPILFFELAKEYSLRDPSLKTYTLQTLPLIGMAKCRVDLDCHCTSDKSVMAAIGFLESAYLRSISKLILQRHSTDEMEEFFKEHYTEFWKNKKDYIEQMLAPFLDERQSSNVPSPKWIFSHGLDAFGADADESAFPPGDWNKIRKKTAEKSLRMISDTDAEITRNPKAHLEKMMNSLEDD